MRDVRVGLRGSADEVAAPDASSSPAGTDSSGARTDLDGVLADGMDAVNALPQGGVDMRTPAAMFEAAVERVQAREHTASPDAPSRWRRGLELSKLVETELMETGHNANNLKDYVTARLNFQACYEHCSRPAVAQLSAANMALKLGEPAIAVFEYQQILLRRELPASLRLKAVAKLLSAAVELKRDEHREKYKLPTSWEDLPKLLEKPNWHQAIIPPSDDELAATLDVYDAPTQESLVPPKPRQMGSVVVPMRTEIEEAPSSMAGAEVQAWQRRLLPRSSGSAYPSARGVADPRHAAEHAASRHGAAPSEVDEIFASHTGRHIGAATTTLVRRRKASAVAAPDRIRPFALLLLFFTVAVAIARLALPPVAPAALLPPMEVKDVPLKGGGSRRGAALGEVIKRAKVAQKEVVGKAKKVAQKAKSRGKGKVQAK